MKFFEPGRTRISICPAIVSVSAPTVAELNAGTMISALLDRDGIEINHDTQTISRTKWFSNQEVEYPTRFATSFTVRGYRHIAAVDNVLLNLFSTFRQRKFIVVRRGGSTDTAWAAGQLVEVYHYSTGKRTPISGGASMFSVPLYVSDQDDAAVVAA